MVVVNMFTEEPHFMSGWMDVKPRDVHLLGVATLVKTSCQLLSFKKWEFPVMLMTGLLEELI